MASSPHKVCIPAAAQWATWSIDLQCSSAGEGDASPSSQALHSRIAKRSIHITDQGSSVSASAPLTTSPNSFCPASWPSLISSMASLLITCTTYSGVSVTRASLTARPVASPCRLRRASAES